MWLPLLTNRFVFVDFQAEVESQTYCSLPFYKFQNGVVDHCIALMADHKEMRSTKLSYWLSYLHLLVELYLQIRPSGFTLIGLSNLLFKALDILTEPSALENFDEVKLKETILEATNRQ